MSHLIRESQRQFSHCHHGRKEIFLQLVFSTLYQVSQLFGGQKPIGAQSTDDCLRKRRNQFFLVPGGFRNSQQFFIVFWCNEGSRLRKRGSRWLKGGKLMQQKAKPPAQRGKRRIQRGKPRLATDSCFPFSGQPAPKSLWMQDFSRSLPVQPDVDDLRSGKV